MDDIQELIRKDLKSYLETKEGMKFNPHNMALCPFHDDTKPSFSVNQKDGTWVFHCFGCDKKGSIINFVMEKEGISKGKAIKHLKDYFGMKDKSNKKQIDRVHFYKNEKGRKVFKKIKYSDGSWSLQHRNQQGRWIPGKGKSKFIPYNLEKFKDNTMAFVCEGERDADTAQRLLEKIRDLIDNVVATTAPTGVSSFPNELLPYFQQFEWITFCFDVGNDSWVVKHARKLKTRFPETDITQADIPLQKKEADLTDWIKQSMNEKDAFLDVICMENQKTLMKEYLEGNTPFYPWIIEENKKVWLINGLRDVDDLYIKLGIPATTFPFGVNYWKPKFAKFFKDKIVYIYLGPGNEKQAEIRAKDLSQVAEKVKIIELPELEKYSQNISDWIELHDSKTYEELGERLEGIAERTPAYRGNKKLIFLSDVQPESITWLWYNRFPEGKLSLLVGDPDAGKGILSSYMTGIFTTGKDWPDKANDKTGSVIFMSTEDNLEDTIRPRMEAAGANLSKVATLKVDDLTIQSVVKELKDVSVSREMEDLKLVFIDSINSYMGGTRGNEEISVRTSLAPLVEFAGKNKITIIGISHLNKDQAKKAIYRTTGSLAYVAMARSCYAIHRDADDPEKRRRLFIPLKSNLAINPTSLAFRIEGPMGFPKVTFEPDPIEVDADQEMSSEEIKNESSALEEAREYCREALKDGPVRSSKFLQEAEDNKIAESTLKRAKQIENVTSYRDKDRNGEWYTAIRSKQ